jgi:hypothetical protein
LIGSLSDFYTAGRSILVKSERYFDRYDQVFAHTFAGAELPDLEGLELDEMARGLLEEWLQNPREMADALGLTKKLQRLTPEELLDYFKARLKDQDGEHHGGNRWIGTGGTSPVGHSGYHPGGMRVGGVSRNKSAVKVALDRRYRDYSLSGPLKASMMNEALKRLRHLVPTGPRDQVNVDATIYQTMKNGGEIEIVFDRDLKDRLKVILAIDNGGWSMDPYVQMVQTLFDYARAQFKELKTFFSTTPSTMPSIPIPTGGAIDQPPSHQFVHGIFNFKINQALMGPLKPIFDGSVKLGYRQVAIFGQQKGIGQNRLFEFFFLSCVNKMVKNACIVIEILEIKVFRQGFHIFNFSVLEFVDLPDQKSAHCRQACGQGDEVILLDDHLLIGKTEPERDHRCNQKDRRTQLGGHHYSTADCCRNANHQLVDGFHADFTVGEQHLHICFGHILKEFDDG